MKTSGIVIIICSIIQIIIAVFVIINTRKISAYLDRDMKEKINALPTKLLIDIINDPKITEKFKSKFIIPELRKRDPIA